MDRSPLDENVSASVIVLQQQPSTSRDESKPQDLSSINYSAQFNSLQPCTTLDQTSSHTACFVWHMDSNIIRSHFSCIPPISCFDGTSIGNISATEWRQFASQQQASPQHGNTPDGWCSVESPPFSAQDDGLTLFGLKLYPRSGPEKWNRNEQGSMYLQLITGAEEEYSVKFKISIPNWLNGRIESRTIEGK